MESFKKLLKESLKKILFFIRFIFYFSLIITCKKNRHYKKKPRLREQNESFFFNFQMSVFLSFFLITILMAHTFFKQVCSAHNLVNLSVEPNYLHLPAHASGFTFHIQISTGEPVVLLRIV